MRAVLRVALVILVLASTPVRAGPYEDGLAAAKRGDYSTAFRLWKPLAEQGSAESQLRLSALYALGKGVPQDSKQALAWVQKSAAQKNPEARNMLGVIYLNGEVAPQDYEQALSLFRSSAAQGYPEAAGNLVDCNSHL